jgi:hypothetical protein
MSGPGFVVDEALSRGGAARVALFQYCVRSVTPEPLFLFASGEYRLRPSHAGALAIYDVFCAVSAPARIRIPEALPPLDLALVFAVDAVRRQLESARNSADADGGGSATGALPPLGGLFAPLAARLRNRAESPLTDLSRRYDPARTPDENLEGGRMNVSQRYFRDKVWTPAIRPRLVAAGFWQFGAID